MRTRPLLVAPSVLTADLARIGDEVAALQRAGADRIHWDVMDGRFVPNLTFGPHLIASARPHATLPFEAHLMVADPDRLLARWVEAGCEIVTVHVEACAHLHRTLDSIKQLGAKAGVAVNPATPPTHVEHVLDLVDVILVMTVDPGLGGQRYLTSMEPKVSAVRRLVERSEREIEVQVDGGISADTVGAAWTAGATSVVSGSALFRHDGGPAAAISELRNICWEAAHSRMPAGV